MTITARYPGRCSKCGRSINPGDEINWQKGVGSEHVKCPKTAPIGLPAKSAAQTRTPSQPLEPGQILKVFTSRYKDSVSVGYTFRTKEGQILTVARVTCRWINQNEVDDQDDFRQGGDPFYEYRAVCREAAGDEAAPVIAKEQEHNRKAQARKRLEEIEQQIRKVENHVAFGAQFPAIEGVEPLSIKINTTVTLHLSSSGIWVGDHGYDWDNDWRIPYNEALATELRTLGELLK